ncbi:MAG: hypothetical protein GY863_13520 [bacterium]|nr:hypothetical protein [bacterium]
MSEITISIPSLHDIKHHVEVEVKINGERHLYNYRVEKFKWTDVGLENRVEGLKQMIAAYDKKWKLFSIGLPTEELIPVMFKQKVH